MSLTIASLAEMKAELGITASDTADDTNLTGLMTRMQGAFDSHCRRRFAAADGAVEIHDGGSPAIWLMRPPVHALTSILVDGVAIDVDDDIYGPSPAGRIVWAYNAAKWPGEVAGIRVTYDGGLFDANGALASGALDGDPNAASDAAAIRRAFFMQVSFEWRNRMTLGAASLSAQGQSVSLAPAKMLPEVETILRNYARLA